MGRGFSSRWGGQRGYKRAPGPESLTPLSFLPRLFPARAAQLTQHSPMCSRQEKDQCHRQQRQSSGGCHSSGGGCHSSGGGCHSSGGSSGGCHSSRGSSGGCHSSGGGGCHSSGGGGCHSSGSSGCHGKPQMQGQQQQQQQQQVPQVPQVQQVPQQKMK
ncbi:loricrin-like [Prinia subflava]|uniref:loricrin-like n=1 Tax=Prinia subflava TaxID=208062 RepID=UPI002FE37617